MYYCEFCECLCLHDHEQESRAALYKEVFSDFVEIHSISKCSRCGGRLHVGVDVERCEDCGAESGEDFQEGAAGDYWPMVVIEEEWMGGLNVKRCYR